MSYTLSNIQALCPFGRIGWVSYTVTLDDGRFALAGTWINGDYSVVPAVNADLSARTVGGDGVYVGIGSVSYAPYQTTDWIDFTAGLDTDSAAVAEVQGAYLDTDVTDAATTALTATGNDPTYYATSVSLTTPGAMTVGATAATVITVLGGDGNPTSLYDAVTWTTSDPSVATVDSSGTVTAVAPGTATITAATGSAAAPVLSASGGVTVS